MSFLRILLTVVYVVSVSRALNLLFNPYSVDRVMLQNAGWGWVFPVFTCLGVVTSGITIWYLWSPTTFKFRVAQAGIVIGVIQSYISTYLAINHLDWFRQAAVAKRVAQGLPVSPEALAWASNPVTLIWFYAAAVGLALVTLLLLHFYEVWRLETQGAQRY